MNGMCGIEFIPPLQGGGMGLTRIPSPLDWAEESRAVGAESRPAPVSLLVVAYRCGHFPLHSEGRGLG